MHPVAFQPGLIYILGMMNEQDRAEEMGDGYTNEWQRAAAVSRMREVDAGRENANRLVAEGFCVVVELSPRYCSITDAVIGTCVHVWFVDRSRQVCLENTPPHDPDVRVEIWPALPLAPQTTAAPVEDDGVPF